MGFIIPYIARLPPSKAATLRQLAIAAYWAAQTPLEAKMAGILMDLFAPAIADKADNHA